MYIYIYIHAPMILAPELRRSGLRHGLLIHWQDNLQFFSGPYGPRPQLFSSTSPRSTAS